MTQPITDFDLNMLNPIGTFAVGLVLGWAMDTIPLTLFGAIGICYYYGNAIVEVFGRLPKF